jgi:hypothetical protein
LFILFIHLPATIALVLGVMIVVQMVVLFVGWVISCLSLSGVGISLGKIIAFAGLGVGVIVACHDIVLSNSLDAIAYIATMAMTTITTRILTSPFSSFMIVNMKNKGA